jgi:acyl carrier protein phosphodiesterase
LIAGKFSGEGPLAFFEDILGDSVPVIRRDVPWDDERIRESLYEGMRLAQDICYVRDWSEYKPKEFTPDPFGRDARKMARRVSSPQLSDYTNIMNTISNEEWGQQITVEMADEAPQSMSSTGVWNNFFSESEEI